MKKWNQILMTGIVILGISLQSFTASASQKDMEITATVEENNGLPNYSVVIPAAVSMGSLSKKTDNVQEYEIIVRSEDKNGIVTVSAPEEGSLLNGENALKFTNDFGKQTFQADGTINEKHLNGRIYIAAEEVENVPVGRYSGTTIFSINYSESSDSEKDPTPTPDPTPDPTPSPTPTPDSDQKMENTLDKNQLADGIYSITGKMVKVDKVTASMADQAINHTIKLTVKNGNYFLTLDFTGLDIGGNYGYMGNLSYYLDGYSQNTYGAITGTLQSAVIDAYQTASDGTKISDRYGTDYPKKVTFALISQAVRDGYVPLQVNVPIMDQIAGAGTQQMFLALDWSSLKMTKADDPAFDDQDQNSGGSSTGNGTLGGSTIGGNTLNGSSLGNNTLGNNTLGNNTLGNNTLSSSTLGKNTLGTALKTGDSGQIGLWMLMACTAATVFIKIRSKNRLSVREIEE